MSDRPLTARQQRFVQQYTIDLNATQAAIRAGYSPRGVAVNAHKLLRNAKIQAALVEIMAARSQRTEITADWVLTQLRENVERAMQAVPVLNRDGEETGEWTYQGHVANRSLELIGKHLRMFPDQHEVTGRDGEPVKIRWIETILDSRVIEGKMLADGLENDGKAHLLSCPHDDNGQTPDDISTHRSCDEQAHLHYDR